MKMIMRWWLGFDSRHSLRLTHATFVFCCVCRVGGLAEQSVDCMIFIIIIYVKSSLFELSKGACTV